MNIVLLVVDSLRARSLASPSELGPRTPFLDRLGAQTTHFRRAYSTECWTLPAHCSMFTGLLPSEHGAHFQTMAYSGSAPTLAEILRGAGYQTEIVTRNSLFDGTIPGVTRGFLANTRCFAPSSGGLDPLPLVVAVAKPRVRRLIRRSGFFGALQRENRSFVMTLARMGVPADRLVLDHALQRMADHRRRAQPYFLFLNLYDVHAPYSPSPTSPLRSFRSLSGCVENLALPFVLPRISGHAYLRPGFRVSAWTRRMLLARYHRAIELMDEKLADFYAAARGAHLLDDTLLVVTSDHGEAFGDHDLYFHDASVYDTHLHVPLWIHHPDVASTQVDDVVSTRDLFSLMRAVGLGHGLNATLLDPTYRRAHPVALAEHFHYPHTAGLLAGFKQNLAAAIVGRRKVIVRREGAAHYDLDSDPDETAPAGGTLADFESACRRDGVAAPAVAAALAHLQRSSTATAPDRTTVRGGSSAHTLRVDAMAGVPASSPR
jgi:arylsulfatase A-like enzyme